MHLEDADRVRAGLGERREFYGEKEAEAPGNTYGVATHTTRATRIVARAYAL